MALRCGHGGDMSDYSKERSRIYSLFSSVIPDK